jgi:hypothetical protein
MSGLWHDFVHMTAMEFIMAHPFVVLCHFALMALILFIHVLLKKRGTGGPE